MNTTYTQKHHTCYTKPTQAHRHTRPHTTPYHIHITHTHFSSPLAALQSRWELCHFQGYDSASRACCYKHEVRHQLCHPPGKACRVSSKFAFWPEEKGVDVFFFSPFDCSITHLTQAKRPFLQTEVWVRLVILFEIPHSSNQCHMCHS